MNDIKEKEIVINNKKISYYDEGSNESKVLLCLHGFAESKERFTQLIDKMNPHYRILTLDFPDHGLSDKYDQPRLDLYVEIVKKFLSEKDINQVNLIGFSMGGLISLMLATKYPDTVNKMVIWESCVDFGGMKRFKLVKSFFKLINKHDRTREAVYHLGTSRLGRAFLSTVFGDQMAESFMEANSDTMSSLVDDMGRVNLEENIKGFDKSTLLICGTSIGTIVSKRKMRELEKMIPSASLKEVKGAHHYSRDETLVLEEIQEFLIGER